MRKKQQKTLLRHVIFLMLVIGAAGAGVQYFGLADRLKSGIAWLAGLGPWSYAGFILVYMAASLFFLPVSILTLGAGLLYGLAEGFFISWAATVTAAAADFTIGRYARAWAKCRTERFPLLKALNRIHGRKAWKVILLSRLSPVLPFAVLNFSFAFCRVPFRTFLAATAAGEIPQLLVYVYLGTLTGSVWHLGAGDGKIGPYEVLLFGLGFAATLALTVLLARYAGRSLEAASREEAEAAPDHALIAK